MNTPTSEVNRPPVHLLLDIAQAAVDFQHLVFLDQVWTGASESYEFDERDREALLALGNRVHDQLATVERHVHNLHRFFGSYGAWVDARLRDVFAGDDLTGSQKDDIRRILAVEDEKYAERGLALSDFLMGRLPGERDALRGKVHALRGNGPVVADVAHDVGCGLLALGTMGSLIFCPETGIGCVIAFVEGAALVHFCS